MPPIIDEAESLLSAPGLHSGLLTVALKALADRSLIWCASIGAGVAWGFTVYHPEPWRLVAAVGYSLCVLVPILVRDTRGA